MEFFSGLDVGMERTAICVVDDKGEVQMQTEVVTDPDAIMTALRPFLPRLRRVGHEAGSLSPWLQPELTRRGLSAVCLETRHGCAAMSAQRNKTDATDALALAHIVRTGWFRQAHIKTESCYRKAFADAAAQPQAQGAGSREYDPPLAEGVRHPHQGHRAHRLRRGGARGGGWRCAHQRADGRDADGTSAVLWKQYCRLHDLVVKFVARHEVCRRFMAIPGVGPVTALSFVTAIDDPQRFRRSRDVAAYFGLTSRRWQSGTSVDGRDASARRAMAM